MHNDDFNEAMKSLEKAVVVRLKRELLSSQAILYSQIESLAWLQKRLSIKGELPPLRGWATSPDVLLQLHKYIMTSKPEMIVEVGSGASTLVIADALAQNGRGKLVSLEHSSEYASKTLSFLESEDLESYVELRVDDLKPWPHAHMTSANESPSPKWYSADLIADLEGVNLLWVDGPPGKVCKYSRYPALPALKNKLAPGAEVWMDDTVREEEQEICRRWADEFGFEVEYLNLEKGLGKLRPQSKSEPENNDAQQVQVESKSDTLKSKLNFYPGGSGPPG